MNIQIREKIKNHFETIYKMIVLFFFSICTFPIKADLPQPPSADMANSSSDWIDVGGTLVSKALKIGLIALGAIILAASAGLILKSFHTAHERQDLGHFFKMLIVGLIAAALGMGLVYAGYSIVNT